MFKLWIMISAIKGIQSKISVCPAWLPSYDLSFEAKFIFLMRDQKWRFLATPYSSTNPDIYSSSGGRRGSSPPLHHFIDGVKNDVYIHWLHQCKHQFLHQCKHQCTIEGAGDHFLIFIIRLNECHYFTPLTDVCSLTTGNSHYLFNGNGIRELFTRMFLS